MTLDQYLKAGPDTAAALAERCGVSAASISRIRKGEQNITLALAETIVRETGAKVPYEELAKAISGARAA